MLQKFGWFNGEEDIPHDYGDIFFQGSTSSGERIVIGPTGNQIELLTDLAALAIGPWFVLYVLVMPRRGRRPPGRYESSLFESHAVLSGLLHDYQAFFEQDGRHHVWVGTVAGRMTLVYDRHNVIFAYGPIEEIRATLVARGFQEKSFWFPAPHSHHYHKDFDDEEERLMSEDVGWRHLPLKDGDDW